MALISAGTTLLDAGALAADATNLVKLSSTSFSESGNASITFTSGINSTYKIYKFEFINVHPATNDVDFGVQFSIDGGSNYDVAKTGSGHQLQGDEAGSSFTSGIQSIHNAAQVTARTILTHSTGNGGDEQFSGHMFLYNPASTTFVKSYFGHFQTYHANNLPILHTTQGYANTTSAINAVKFDYTSGNIDTGTFTMYGVKT